MFWDNFTRECKKRGKSPTAVCHDLGLSSTAAVRWKEGSIPQSRTLTEICNYFGVTREYMLSDNQTPMLTAIPRADVHFVPLFNSVSAGFGALAESQIVDYIPTVCSASDASLTIAIRVIGDSMSPKIENGDIIIVHKQTSVDSGSLAVVLLDGEEGLVKKVEYGKTWIHLISLNPIYPPMEFRDAEVTRLQVVGKVQKIIKDA